MIIARDFSGLSDNYFHRLIVGFNRVSECLRGALFWLAFSIYLFTQPAFAETRNLKLYYLHTGEKATITYKQDGKFLEEGLKKVNWFLRD